MPGKLYGLKVSNTRQKSKLSKIDLNDPLEGELQLTQMPSPLMDRNRIRTALRSLSNGACVNDDVVVSFSKMFNEWEYKTFLADSNYRGAIVMTSNLVEKLCFQQNSRTLRTAYDPDSFHRSLTMTLGKGLEKKLAAIDVFEQNSLLIFPHNEGIRHWVILCVDPVSLKQ